MKDWGARIVRSSFFFFFFFGDRNSKLPDGGMKYEGMASEVVRLDGATYIHTMHQQYAYMHVYHQAVATGE